ncbi:hypothetical protein EC973_007106 [Apophysomyces ossiformis]|uniref:STAS domain-containing protein n=1 Tax=Apophysomyces ossiformis TaxID=679940 RepID=A0A8H7ETG3_9FUNG|nr:hypothetical protein EC973_007106 [Apophysomyces ossiformis]
MTGSAITIALGQWPKLFGMQEVDTHQPPYSIFIQFFANLPSTTLDAAFGLLGLTVLYAIRFGAPWFTKKFPRFGRSMFYLGIMRAAIVMIFGTLLSYVICANKSETPISLVETIPVGFDSMAVPSLNLTVISKAGSSLPSIVIVLLLEHITVAKSFGKVYGYTIRADQEILAIGISNVVGAFFGAYPATGAFSRTAVMARSGSKTPLAGIFSSAIVALALYVLTPAFYYVPDAILAAVVVHAVSDLISGPAYVKELWKQSFSEFLVFVGSVLIACFVSVEDSIYAAIACSLMIMLIRLARPSVKTLARYPLESNHPSSNYEASRIKLSLTPQRFVYVDDSEPTFFHLAEPLPSGVLVIRFAGPMLYPNAAYVTEKLLQIVKDRTCNGASEQSEEEQLWCQETKEIISAKDGELPVLETLVLDMGAVSQIDSTALQLLVKTRQLIDRYAGRDVEWHFASVQTHKIHADLVAIGFGRSKTCATDRSDETTQVDSDSFEEGTASDKPRDSMTKDHTSISIGQQPAYPLPRYLYPCFHWDVDTAVHSVSENWQARLGVAYEPK